jgi:hypothetical protein
MAYICIKMRDGTQREFKDTPRPGGSYEKKVRYESSVVVVTDEWYKEIAIPLDLVAEVQVIPSSRW